MSGLLKVITPLLNITRNVGKKKFVWPDGGIRYPGFVYYPRYPDFKDPPYKPTKLFRVQRIKPLKGVPFWEKNILREFKLDGKTNDYVVIKNIPENNQRLWKVKHLIKIAPVTFPDGVPTDSEGTYLKENGELRVIKRVKNTAERLKLAESHQNDVKKLDGETLRKDSRLKWLNAWE